MLTSSPEETATDAHTVVPVSNPKEKAELHTVELSFETPIMVNLSLEEYTERCREQMAPIVEGLHRKFPGMTMEAHPNMGIIEVEGTTQEIARVLQATGAKMLPWGIHRGTRIAIECATDTGEAA